MALLDGIGARPEAIRAVLEAVVSGRLDPADVRVSVEGPRVRAAAQVHRLGGVPWLLMLHGDSGKRLCGLLDEALNRAGGARRLVARVAESSADDALRAGLARAGFAVRGVRSEFRSPVVPTDDRGSPLAWRAAPGPGEAAGLLVRCCEGDPHAPDTRDPERLLRGWLAELPGPILLGDLGGETVALVLPQVDPAHGWSRIVYAGVVPSHRGRGLGTWVLRKGLAVLAERGAVVYQDGCASSNEPMVRVLRRRGIVGDTRLVEWLWEA